MHVAYYRVSTAKQGSSGLGLEAQRRAVMDYIGQPIAEYTEVESGKRNNRPQLEAALAYCRLTGSTLVVAKLDRLSRNAAFLNTLFDSGQPVSFADMPNADRLMVGMMAQLAQWEAERISRRTKEALHEAKARGRKLGGDRGNLASVSRVGHQRSIQVRQERAQARKADLQPHIDAARAEGHTSLRTVAAYLNARHIKTAQGKAWNAASVRRILG